MLGVLLFTPDLFSFNNCLRRLKKNETFPFKKIIKNKLTSCVTICYGLFDGNFSGSCELANVYISGMTDSLCFFYF